MRAGRYRYRLIYQYMEHVPICLERVAVKESSNRLISLVDAMLTLQKQEQSTTHPHDKDHLRRQIETTDRQIDDLVYELYGLTEEEIGIVESATAVD